MDATDFINALLEATVATSLAILLVLGSRRGLRAAFGARVAYGAWALVPVALVAVLLPAAPEPMAIAMLAPGSLVAAPAQMAGAGAYMLDLRWLLLAAWLLGVAAAVLALAGRQRRFHGALGRLHPRDEGMQAEATQGLPAAMGWWRPAVILPADFDNRYSTDQRVLMVAHERIHIARGDLHANAFVAALRCLFWFNPLLHFAARRFRHDQELACDACVIARHPGARRAYGEALLQAQFAVQGVPLGCHFGFGHPLRERVAMLGKPVPSSLRWVAGSAFVTAIALGAGFAAWAAQPADVAASAGVAGVDSVKLVNLRMRIDVDGRSVSTPEIVNHSGRAFSVGDGRFQLEMAATALANGRIGLVGQVFRDERAIGKVNVELDDGKPATVRFDDVALTVDASTAAGRVAMPMHPSPPPPLPPPPPALPTPPGISVIHTPAPPYPKEALDAGISGKVVLLVDVAADGSVAGVKVESSTSPDSRLGTAAAESARKWRFTSKVENGKPVASQVRVPVEFRSHG